MWPKAARVWFVPVAACACFFYILLYTIPYAPGYGWALEPLGMMMRVVWRTPDWEHAAFVPYICLFLIYLRRKDILQAPIRGNMWGGALILFGVFVYCIGLKAETEYFGFAAVQLLLAGVTLWFWGIRVFSIVSFAWLFFFFAWPMPFLDGMVALPLRLVMSHTSHNILNFLGTANVQSGTAILSAPNLAAGLATGAKFQIDIADPCSGLHSLFALMMISALAAYVSLNNLLFRWLVFFAAIPLAIAGNVVRILLLVWGTQAFGSDFAIGTAENPTWFHMGCGYVVYAVALVLMFTLISLFNSERMRKLGERLTPPPATPADGHLASGI
jgi:exosortase